MTLPNSSVMPSPALFTLTECARGSDCFPVM